MAWEALVDAHVSQALEFISLFDGRISLEDALNRYIREMDMGDTMGAAVRTRVLITFEDEEPTAPPTPKEPAKAKAPDIAALIQSLKVTPSADPLAREDLAFALSVVLLGLLMMVSRRNAVSQVVGVMSLENGLVLAAAGARGMPLVVEISVAFSVLIAFFVIGVFLFRIRERFDTVDVQALDRFRGERR